MIIVQLIGGLGNQLFQYALSRQLAINHGQDVKLDTHWYGTQSLRHYQLADLNIEATLVSFDEINRFIPFYYKRSLASRAIHRIFGRSIPKFYTTLGRIVVEKPAFKFAPEVLEIKKKVLLSGFWQNQNYFKGIKSTLRQEIQLRKGMGGPYFYKMRDEMLAKNTVSIHIRRRDFLKNPTFSICPISYYLNAITHISERLQDAAFYVFSDDLAWARENLNFGKHFLFVDQCQMASEELLLMSTCKHHIIANSTFSWWAAWLGDESALVISPAQWYTDGTNLYDFIPEQWITLE